MQLHQLQPAIKRRRARRIGRGGKRGKTSGRGHKGQKARAGGSGRPEMREYIKKLPKRRGFGKNRAQSVHSARVRPLIVNVAQLEAVFTAGDTVSPSTLAARGIIRTRAGVRAGVKVLGNGTLGKALTVAGCTVSAAAREKITQAGGSVSSPKGA